ncbi:uncharacterized protein N7446_003224 [Penicillium canescens]|uniref:tripeptidyl-peptidase II n=1 Tax=Penicillium canescens TaxID=5083 RepID=A0AAD6IFL3_PENCN|nr:uncharacterized protein N7446_003224 [Penicillium canescens]KAJ6045022.1 hypothetical protein N7460_006377 [Penicillium canescens]KAJ6056492.1 hypothetical protein N7444_005590 [Penicillium canescens]KAJ6075447.1 hypothetical protein N7446_003224 [Penicillium canescens]
MHPAIYTGLLCTLAAPTLGVVWESLGGGVPSSWNLKETPSSDSTMALSIALSRQNLDQLESKLTKLSTPGEAEYGQWLQKHEIDTQFPVVDDTAVVNWLKSAGISNFARDGALLNFTGSVEIIGQLLNASFAYYSNGDLVKLRTTEYSIPDDLTSYIDLISPTVFFGKTRSAVPVPSPLQKVQERRASSTEISPACQTSITPSCLKEMYNVGDYTPEPAAGSRVGFASFLNQSASYSDLADYESRFNIPSQSFTVELLNGGVNNQSASKSDIGEANLDVQLIVAVSHPLPVHEFITGGVAPFLPDADEPTEADDENEPYLIFHEYLLSKTNDELPQVISTSYGDDEQTVPEKYAKRVCNLIGLNTLRGLTIIHSSGDEGVGSACQATDGVTPQFNPIFPATCPYVTAVGGTSDVSPEVAWNASSGGFSNYFSRAWYQNSAVEKYLTNITHETKEYYSKYADFKGRGFPDVSAHSLYPDYQVITAGNTSASGGTSAAAPTFAGIIGLLNDARLRAGKPVLGFLNPFLYSKGFKALNDITAGASYGCGGIDPQSNRAVPGSLIIPGAHWNATEGWDPVTGLGTPNFQELKKLVLAL